MENDVIPLSALLMLRLPLFHDDSIDRARIQPYVGIGPSLFTTYTKVRRFGGVTEGVEEGSLNLGLDARAGVAFQLNELVALFVEYRLDLLPPARRGGGVRGHRF